MTGSFSLWPTKVKLLRSENVASRMPLVLMCVWSSLSNASLPPTHARLRVSKLLSLYLDVIESLFSFRIPRMSRPILKEFMRSRTTKPPPKIKMSPTRPDFNSFSWFGQEGKRYAAFYQPKRIPLLPRSFYRGRDAGGPGARASWVGV